MVQRELSSGKTPHKAVKNTVVRKILKQLGYVEVRKPNRKSFVSNELPIDKKIIIHTRKHICVFENMGTYDVIPTSQIEAIFGYFVKK